jgi:hypothetical protein
LEDLESKAREFEIMANVNLPKMIGMLESKEEQITYLRSKDKLSEAQFNHYMRQKEAE